MKDYYASDEVGFRLPRDEKPPGGVRLYLLTRAGICVIGHWSNDGAYVAWSPLLKIPAHIKEELHRRYLQG